MLQQKLLYHNLGHYTRLLVDGDDPTVSCQPKPYNPTIPFQLVWGGQRNPLYGMTQ